MGSLELDVEFEYAYACSAQKPQTKNTNNFGGIGPIITRVSPLVIHSPRPLTTSLSVICQDSDKPHGVMGHSFKFQ